MNNFEDKFDKTTEIVINEIRDALLGLDKRAADKLLDDILAADDVFLVGVGRVMLSLQAFCKRLSHLGIKAHCVGDITEPAIKNTDLLIVASGSGESIVPVAIAKKAKELGAKVVHIGSNPKGAVSEYIDYMVRVPTQTRLYLKDEIESQQIMTSLFEQVLLILGDILSKLIVDNKNLDLKSLWQWHANLE